MGNGKKGKRVRKRLVKHYCSRSSLGNLHLDLDDSPVQRVVHNSGLLDDVVFLESLLEFLLNKLFCVVEDGNDSKSNVLGKLPEPS